MQAAFNKLVQLFHSGLAGTSTVYLHDQYRFVVFELAVSSDVEDVPNRSLVMSSGSILDLG
jgi:hypothetical protein